MEIDRKMTELAETQYGLLSHGQATALGLGRHAIEHRLATGRWLSPTTGVYRLPGTPPTWEQRVMVLVLASGPVAAASHRSAAALLGIPGFARHGVVEVTTPRPRRHRDPDAVVHRWRVLPEDHLTVIEGLVTTRTARTLVDLAGVLHPARTERAVDNCLAAGLVNIGALRATFDDLAQRGRRGIALMRRLLEARDSTYVAPASELEARFLALVRNAGVPEPVRQLDIGNADDWIGRVDFAYPQVKLVIELDSRRHHSADLDRQSDEARDARLHNAGWRVLRISWDELVTDPDAVGASVSRWLRLSAA